MSVTVIFQLPNVFHNSEDLVSVSKLVQTIFARILDEKMHRIQLEAFVNDRKRTSVIDPANILHRFVEDALAELPVLPVEEIKAVVEIVEGRRQKFVENRATVVAGLIGAAVGAILTAILGSNRPETVQHDATPHVLVTPAPPPVPGDKP